jgi:hypothetical protein
MKAVEEQIVYKPADLVVDSHDDDEEVTAEQSASEIKTEASAPAVTIQQSTPKLPILPTEDENKRQFVNSTVTLRHYKTMLPTLGNIDAHVLILRQFVAMIPGGYIIKVLDESSDNIVYQYTKTN